MAWQVRDLAGCAGEVTSVAFSPDGQHVVCGSWGGFVKIWDIATGVVVSNFVPLR